MKTGLYGLLLNSSTARKYCSANMVVHISVRDAQPLHKAAREGRDDLIPSLIESGCSVNAAKFDQFRPLHEACARGQKYCAEALIKAGADVNGRDIDGSTPLCYACHHGHKDCLEMLLSHGAFVNPPLVLTTPLHECVLHNNWKCVDIMVANGAKMNVSDLHFGTPLHIAAVKGYIESARILLEAGAQVNAVKMHQSVLHDSIQTESCDMLNLLLQHGAGVLSRNNQGKTARELLGDQYSPCGELLYRWECTPRSLLHICRLTIRRTLGASRLKFINKIPIPKQLCDFVLHKNE